MQMKGLHILFIDDDPFGMRPTVQGLERKGATVTLITDASSALQHLTKNSAPQPDLIILDIMMSSGNALDTPDSGRSTGIELLKAIRKNLMMKTPIIISTVVSDHDLISALLAVEQLMIVQKPYILTELVDAIARV